MRGENQTKANFEVIIAKNSPKLEKDIKLLIQEAPQTPGRITENEIYTDALNDKTARTQKWKKKKNLKSVRKIYLEKNNNQTYS